jgi:hypothetical protein
LLAIQTSDCKVSTLSQAQRESHLGINLLTRTLDSSQINPSSTPAHRTSASMFYSTLLIATSALAGLVSAQNYSTSGPLSIVPSSVDYDLRLSWCRAQTNSCPQICGGQAYPNSCDAVSVTNISGIGHLTDPHNRPRSTTPARVPTAPRQTSRAMTRQFRPSSARSGRPTALTLILTI